MNSNIRFQSQPQARIVQQIDRPTLVLDPNDDPVFGMGESRIQVCKGDVRPGGDQVRGSCQAEPALDRAAWHATDAGIFSHRIDFQCSMQFT